MSPFVPRERLVRILVILVAAHSYAVAFVLLFAPHWALGLAGWPPEAAADLFFPRQSGAFHVVLATGYLLEYFQYRGIALLVSAKILAAGFLFTSAATGDVAWAIPLLGLTDGLMGLAVLAARRAARRSGTTSPAAGPPD